jgi:TonB family protein
MNSSTHAHAAQVLPARAVLFLGIAGFHALLAYLFASGLIAQTIHILRPGPPMEYIDIKQKAPPPPTPTPVQAPTPFIAKVVDPLPLPVINPAVEPPIESSAPIATSTFAPAADAPVAPPPIRLIGRNVMPSSADYYPASDVRMGYEGTTEIRSCVNASGVLDGSPTVEATSGRASLDRAAVRLAREGKYARAMRGEMPVANCYRFRVTFTLH